MSSALNSYAKINLGLRIGPVRPDGFHALATVYQTIDLCDQITVAASLAATTEITIRCADARVPTDARNTCWKIVAAALERMGVQASVSIDIIKRLAVQGGLGAGSANAAAALLGLERELAGLAPPLSQQDRLAIAAATGSDVPLFLIGGTVWGTGRGEIARPLADSPAMACVVAVPECAVSTPQAFRDWDAKAANPGAKAPSTGEHFSGRKAAASTGAAKAVDGQRASESNPQAMAALTESREFATLNELNRSVAAVWRLDDASGVFSVGKGLAENPLLALVQTGIENDFESVVFPQQPWLRDLKLALAGSTPDTPTENQAIYAALSGSGAALFGLYPSDIAAALAAKRVRSMGCKVLVTKTLGREEMQGLAGS